MNIFDETDLDSITEGTGLSVNQSIQDDKVHKYTATLTYEFYGEPNISTTDVFRHELEQQFKEDPSYMLEGIKWESHPIEIVRWQRGEYKGGKFVATQGGEQ